MGRNFRIISPGFSIIFIIVTIYEALVGPITYEMIFLPIEKAP
jgi:hypothetical protein